MKTSPGWIRYFETNLTKKRINWELKPSLGVAESNIILSSLQAWQLAETSDGKNLLFTAEKYARKTGDNSYPAAIKLFIKEEQKHGQNLGLYLDAIKQPRIRKNWDDTLFRQVRAFNTSMELWTLTVLTVEITAQIFYQSLKKATTCQLLQQICTDKLVDEAAHIIFQKERLSTIYEQKGPVAKYICRFVYPLFYFATALVVWLAHKKVFKAGGNYLSKYLRLMRNKYRKNLAPFASAPPGSKPCRFTAVGSS